MKTDCTRRWNDLVGVSGPLANGSKFPGGKGIDLRSARLTVTSEVAARICEGPNSPSLSLATVLGRFPALRAAARCIKAVPVDIVRRGIGAVWSNEVGDVLAGLTLKMWLPERKIFPPTALREPGFESGVLARVSTTSPLLGSFATDVEQDRVPGGGNDGDADFVPVNAGISSYLK